MRLVSSLATCVILALALAACASDEDGGSEGEERFPVTLESGSSLDDAEPCGVDDPECPDGTICAVVRLEGGDSEPSCVSETICEDEVTCGDNAECVVAESFPYQIFCSGTCTGADCDDPTQS